MAEHKRLISKAKAEEMLAAGEAVLSGTEEHDRMMMDLWERVAKKFVFITSAGNWAYRDKGTDKGLVNQWAAQKSVNAEFRTTKPVVRFGRADGKAWLVFETPQLDMATNPWLEAKYEEYKPSKREMALGKLLTADFWDTYPNQPRIVELEDGSRVFNLWHEPTVRACRDAIYQEPRWFLDVVERFFGEHETEREYFLDWCAHLVCRPDIKMPVSVLLISSLTGAGKGFIADALKWMVGERNFKALASDALKGHFQSFIPGTTLAVVNELYEGGNYGFADKLKTLQTEDQMFVNLKYGPQENVRNFLHFLAFSNNAAPINLDEGDRRWFVFASPQKEPMDAAWWAERWRFMKPLPHWGALGSLRRWFGERMKEIERTGRFRPFERPPMTEHKLSIVEDSRSPFFTHLKGLLEDGELVPNISGVMRLSDIEASIVSKNPAFRKPPAGTVTADLESLGLTYERSKTGRFWRLPVGYQMNEGLKQIC